MAGIDSLYDLTAEDIAALPVSEIQAHIVALNGEFAGRQMDRRAKDLWNTLNGVVEEFEVREARINELVNPRIREAYDRGHFESSTDDFKTQRPTRRRPIDSRKSHHLQAAQSMGLRAIDTNTGTLSARAADRLDEVVREKDEFGIGGKYLAAVADPHYYDAFGKILQHGPLATLHMSPAEQESLHRVTTVVEERDARERAMSLTTTSGGFAVPFVLDPTVLATSDGAVNPYRAISAVESISVDEWRGVSSAGVTATFQAEAAAVTDASPTLAQPTVSTEMARAFIPFSIEIGQDWSTFAGEMAKLIQDGKDVLEATKFALGSGTNEPFGVITGATTLFTASNTNSLVVADLYGVHGALGPRFRARAAWTMNNATADRIRQLSTAGGADLWAQNLRLRTAAVGDPMTDGRLGADLLGKPAYEASGQSGTFTTGQKIAVVGDYSRYYKIVDRIGLNVEVIPHLFGAAQGNLPTGQRGLFAYWRVGAKVLDANAFRVLRLA